MITRLHASVISGRAGSGASDGLCKLNSQRHPRLLMIRRALHSVFPCQDVGRHLANFSQHAREMFRHMSDGENMYR